MFGQRYLKPQRIDADTGYIKRMMRIGGYYLPITDGAAGQALITNGSGIVTWDTVTIDTTHFLHTSDLSTYVKYDSMPFKYSGTNTIQRSGGNVGIGTTSPKSTLEIDGSLSTVPLYVDSSDVATYGITNLHANIIYNSESDVFKDWKYNDSSYLHRQIGAGAEGQQINLESKGRGKFYLFNNNSNADSIPTFIMSNGDNITLKFSNNTWTEVTRADFDDLDFNTFSLQDIGLPVPQPPISDAYLRTIDPCNGNTTMTDSRNGYTYPIKSIGTRCWMTQNIDVGTKVPTAINNENQTNNGQIEKWGGSTGAQPLIEGALYTKGEAHQYTTANNVGICPNGWHLSRTADWDELISIVPNIIAGGCMKEKGTTHWQSPNSWATDWVGWKGIPNGYKPINYPYFGGSQYGYWWSYDGNLNSSSLHYRLNYNNGYVNIEVGYNNKWDGMSVRCVAFPNVCVYPTITTNPVSNITYNAITIGGNVINQGGTDSCVVIARGVCWSTTQNPTINNSHTTDGTGIGWYQSTCTGLSENTVYYIRAYATNWAGTQYGNQVIAKTLPFVPTCPPVITVIPSNVWYTTATSGGYVSSNGGGSSVTERGVCWSTTNPPTLADAHTNDGIGLGLYRSSITGLQPNTKYYIRAYAINNVGTCYGSYYYFTTKQSNINPDPIKPE